MFPGEENQIGILHELNKQQKKAVTCEDKRVLILAGAGSGKTRTFNLSLIMVSAPPRAKIYSDTPIAADKSPPRNMYNIYQVYHH